MHTAEADRVFVHEALLYSGLEGFVAGSSAFIREGLNNDEPILVVVSGAKIEALRDALGPSAGCVRFADMANVGENPARIIPAWRDFAHEHEASGRPFRGIGEPVWAARTPQELAECQRHESLLNVAFDGSSTPWRLMCPYDVTTLDSSVIEEARRSHPYLVDGTDRSASIEYADVSPFVGSLPDPPVRPAELGFTSGSLEPVRRFIDHYSGTLPAPRRDDLVLAVNELATNSVRHGGGSGIVRIWRDGDSVVGEVRDAGVIADPLIGRIRPGPGNGGGRGLWLVHHLCDLVQIRSSPEGGTVVRVHMRF